jgi:hypothetical protein
VDEVVNPAVVVVDDEAVELLPVVEPAVLAPLESLALAVEPPALAVPAEVEGAGAFGAFAACARSRVPPQATAAHTIPIAIRRLTRFEALQN